MNQKELNAIAMNFIYNQSIEVAAKLRQTLEQDLKERSKQVSGPALHYIHNVALFDCLVHLDSIAVYEVPKEKTLGEYLSFAEKFRSKFLEIIEEL